jgi:hypothetical protein
MLLASGAVAVLVVTAVPWCYYGVSPAPSARLSQPRVHNWSFKGPGGRYGITEESGFRRTRKRLESAMLTGIWLGPLSWFALPVSAPVAALSLMGSSILLFGLGFYGISKLRNEKQTV